MPPRFKELGPLVLLVLKLTGCQVDEVALQPQKVKLAGSHSAMIMTYGERQGDSFKGCEDFCLKNGSSQGNNLALTVLFVPNSFDSERVFSVRSKVGL